MVTASSSPIPGPHLVRYGIAADQYFLVGDLLETYDQLVINANIVAQIPAGLASFLLQRACQKAYFIDPQTHAFQHDVSSILSSSDNSQGQIKRSMQALIDAYGEPVARVVGKERNSVLPEDFSDGALRKEFCDRVTCFQTDRIRVQAEQSETAKYLQFLKKEAGLADDAGYGPRLVVAPYFCLTSNTLEDWLDINLKCANDSVPAANRAGVPLAAQIVISRDLLADVSKREHLAEAYASSGVSLFLLWVDSFPEQDASLEELRGFVDLIRALSRGTARGVVSLYGGFLSVALATTRLLPGFQGVTHGFEYGEDRAVAPVGRGFPYAKFYLPALHSRLLFREALRSVDALGGLSSASAFHERVCGCPECQQVIRGDPRAEFYENYGKTYRVRGGRERPTPETKEHCVRHYMWAKQREYTSTQNALDIARNLQDTVEKLQRKLGREAVAHCRAWATILSGSAGTQ
jgi:hypothetical protein